MKKTVLLALFLTVCAVVNSQVSTDRNSLQSSFYEDYDQFLHIVESINPQLEVRKVVTGEDILSELKQLRSSIDTLYQADDFTRLMRKALNKLDDQHATLFDRVDYFAYTDFDSLSIRAAIDAATPKKELPSNIGDYFPLYLEYEDGNYLWAFKFTLKSMSDPKDSVAIPIGSILKKINGKNPEAYFKNNLLHYRWDNDHKKKHTQVRSYLKDLKKDIPIALEYVDLNGVVKHFTYDRNKYYYYTSSPDYIFYIGQTPQVTFFDDESILYIYMPQMGDADFYVDQILEKTRNKDVRKVIWDIRRNPGGDDAVWRKTLEVLLKDTLKYERQLATLDNDMANEILEMNPYGFPIKLPFLNGKYKYVRSENVIVPSESSIRYDGVIYLLQDKQIYSSAGALAAAARSTDKITSIGTTTGKFIGTGIMPQAFQLQHSKLVFQIEPVLDITDVQSPYDYYQDKVEIPVKLTREDWANYLKANNETLYSREFLFNKDPIFR